MSDEELIAITAIAALTIWFFWPTSPTVLGPGLKYNSQALDHYYLSAAPAPVLPVMGPGRLYNTQALSHSYLSADA
jgi:hypothetical protein